MFEKLPLFKNVLLLFIGILSVNQPDISSPVEGDILQGIVKVTGSSGIDDFDYAECSFSYADQEGESWFIISRSEEAVETGDLAEWDTTMIADGIYQLRLRVYRRDGSYLETIVSGLSVRNYSAAEASVSAANNNQNGIAQVPNLGIGEESLEPGFSSNPVEVSIEDLLSYLRNGAVLAFIAFLLFLVYLGLNKLSKR